MPEDVLLLIEVAESSLDHDRGEKLKMYAEAGIPDYWVVNIADRVVEVYVQPEGGTYTQGHRAASGETLALPDDLKGEVKVDDILGTA